MKPISLEIAVRALVERAKLKEKSQRRQSRRHYLKWAGLVLVIDTETTIDQRQALLFGSARLFKWEGGHLVCCGEVLIYANDLPAQDPTGFGILAVHAKSDRIPLLTLTEFLKQWFWPAIQGSTHIVGFNLPFDLSRLAQGWGLGRGKRFRKGFSLRLWELVSQGQKENRHRPRIRIKHIDSKRALLEVSRVGRGVPECRAQFLDLKTLAFALTNKAYTLEAACKAFGVEHGKLAVAEHGRITPEYVEYNRRDVLASAELLEKLRAEFDRHPIDLLPSKALSPASIAKAYLAAMRLRPAAEKFGSFPKDKLAAATMTYFGGRAECRIRCLPIPVVYLDFLSMYPTVNALMKLWRHLTAEDLEAEEATAAIRRFLEGVNLEDMFDSATWTKLPFFALVEPDGDVLPVRARYGRTSDAWNIGINPLRSKTPLWYAGPDLVAAKLLTGKVPRILSAFYLVPKGRQSGLMTTEIRSAVTLDPARQDFFKAVVEQRKGLARRNLPDEEKDRLDAFLKVLANSGSYGIFAELNPEDLPTNKKETLRVFGLDGPFTAESAKPEEPGRFWFMPIASLITAAARLMLALLERCVADAGGTYALCDTDSMAIVATKSGGPVAGLPVPALSWQQVEAIVARFKRLSPYNQDDVPGSILKIENENFEEGNPKCQIRQLFAYVISAKRYALFNLDAEGKVILRKWSEHGLGHLLNPTDPDDESRDWIAQIWQYIVAKALGRSPKKPIWLDRPALSRITASSPDLVERLNQARRRASYPDSIKPFNFLLAAHIAPFGHPADADPNRFQLIAPYESDPRKWLSLRWINRYTGQRHPVTTGERADAGMACIKSYADVLEEYETHPEPKSADQYCEPCSRLTRGLLYRREVGVGSIAYAGKEANQIEDVEAWLVHNWEEIQEVFHDPATASLMAALKQLPAKELARKVGLTPRQIRNIKNGRSRPGKKTAKVLRGIIALVIGAKG